MPNEFILLSFVLLFTKHLVVDFLCQTPFQYLNKGTYGHPGGLLHAFLHGVGTFAVLFLIFGPFISATLAILDGVTHYHIDWAKVKLNNHFNLKPDNSEKYWWLLGLDQYLHCLTYVGLIYAVM